MLPVVLAAMLSTADTFLIAAGQTVSMDVHDEIFFEKRGKEAAEPVSEDDPFDDLHKLSHMPVEDASVVARARRTMWVMGGIGLLVCIGLRSIGFRVSDLVFAVYGSTLALVPVVAAGLFLPSRFDLARSSGAAIASVIAGMAFGWVYGVLAVMGGHRGGEWMVLASAINPFPGDPSVYNSPTAAVGVALVVFVIAIPIERIRRKTRSAI